MTINWGALSVVAAVSLVIGVLVAVAGGIYAASRRRRVTADNVNDIPPRSPQVDLAA